MRVALGLILPLLLSRVQGAPRTYDDYLLIIGDAAGHIDPLTRELPLFSAAVAYAGRAADVRRPPADHRGCGGAHRPAHWGGHPHRHDGAPSFVPHWQEVKAEAQCKLTLWRYIQNEGCEFGTFAQMYRQDVAKRLAGLVMLSKILCRALACRQSN